MKFFRKLKKGFTLVELVVVVAVIAILAAISVVSYTSITNKAKAAADSEIITQLNTQMRAKSIMEGKNETAYDAYLDAKEIGFDLELMKPQSRGNYVWDEEHDLFACVQLKDKQSLEKVIAEDNSTKLTENTDKMWIFTSEIDSEYEFSQYLNSKDKDGNLITAETVEIKSGFDAGENMTVKTIKFDRSAAAEGEGKEVSIRSNNAVIRLGLNAPRDVVNFYGKAGKINGLEENDSAVVAPSSLHIDEKASVAYVKISKGHIENKGSIDLVYITSADVKVTNTGSIDHAHASKDVAVAVNGTSAISGIKFDYNDNADQNDDPEVYHHVTEEEANDAEHPVVGNKPVTGKEEWAEGNVDIAAEAVVDTASGKMVLVKQNGKVDIKVGLDEFRDEWNKGSYFNDFVSAKLTANVNISDVDWNPIGNWEYPFYGTFEGNNKTINGLTAKSIDQDHQGLYSNGDTIGFGETYGLFGIVGGGDLTIKDLKLPNIDINIYDGKNVGSLVGYVPSKDNFADAAKGGQYWSKTAVEGKKLVPENFGTGNVNISNVSVSGSILANGHVGGLIGKVYSSGTVMFDNCKNGLKITETNLGGLAGLLAYASGTGEITVTNCENLEGSELVFAPNSSGSGLMVSEFAYSKDYSKVKCDESNIHRGSFTITKGSLKTLNGGFCYAYHNPLVLEGYTINEVYSISNLTLKNCNVSENTTNYGTMVIDGGVYSTSNNKHVYNYGTMTVNNGTFGAPDKNTNVINGENAVMTINGGIYERELQNSGSLLIKGGTFSAKPNIDLLSSEYILKLENGVWVAQTGEWAVEDSVSGEKYASVEDLVLLTKSNPIKIKLLKDIDVDKTIELNKGTSIEIDLNNHNLSCAILRKNTTSTGYANFKGSGTATLKSGTNLSKVYATGSANIIIEDGVTANRNDGTGSAVVQIEKGTGTITIKGGQITGKLSNDNGNIIIEGGTFAVDDPTKYVDTSKYNVVKSGSTWVVSAK